MYLCSHEMVTVTTKFTIATGDLRTAGRRSRKSKDKNDEQSEPELRSGRGPKGEEANHSSIHHSPLPVEKRQAFHVDIADTLT